MFAEVSQPNFRRLGQSQQSSLPSKLFKFDTISSYFNLWRQLFMINETN